MMNKNALVRSRINSEVKDQATIVLRAMGLSISDVMRIVLTRIAKERALPFELKLIHNAAEDPPPQIGI
jgi:DNA-damage-inducible protein J